MIGQCPHLIAEHQFQLASRLGFAGKRRQRFRKINVFQDIQKIGSLIGVRVRFKIERVERAVPFQIRFFEKSGE